MIVTSDHGEHLGQHGLADHQASLHEELVNCPCAMIAPGLAPGTAIPGQFQHTDLLRTICSFLGVPCVGYEPAWPPLDMLAEDGGRDFAFMQWTVWGPENLDLLQRRNPSYDFAPLNRDLTAVRTDRWKYIAGSDGGETLFDLREEPTEVRDRLQDSPVAAVKLKSALARWMHAIRGEGASAGEQSASDDGARVGAVEKRLRDLGYI